VYIDDKITMHLYLIISQVVLSLNSCAFCVLNKKRNSMSTKNPLKLLKDFSCKNPLKLLKDFSCSLDFFMFL